MTDHIKYLLSPAILGIHGYGLWLGGNFAWLGLGVLLGLLFFDAFLDNDYSMRTPNRYWLYDLITASTMVMGVLMIVFYAWLVGQGHFATTSAAVGAFISMMIVGFVVTAPSVHEMFHRENRLLRFLGRTAQCAIFDPWREITHVVTHHLHVATPNDPDYARRGDTVYGHILRTFPKQWAESYHLEKQLWQKRGRKWCDPRNGWVKKAGTLVAFTGVLWLAGGFAGAALAILTCLLGPRMFLEVFNYCNHYGLISATPGRFKNHHTWNHLTPFVRILALEITNHAGHHDDSYKPFYELEPDREGPKQPQFLMCVLLAFVPPLWFMAIKPLLKHWDDHYATQQEREIAWRENARAGWHDLNPPDYQPSKGVGDYGHGWPAAA